ncbi:MAG: ribonucleotide reductase [Flavobacteriales bacterium]|nr:ribonucleotide reductase [Flavobacteriales bacterium]|tara:strand:+ start:2755 stop:4062 length:1308 start_codon:yes stop_codon:yes gene_type:complete
MQIENIFKRNFNKKPFVLEKITDAVLRAMISVKNGDVKDAEKISMAVQEELIKRKLESPRYTPNVEEIQDLVEKKLMQSEFLDVAKAYILYRNMQSKKRARDMFEKRINLKPYEYPELYEYVPAIRHSYWIHSEFNFTSDIQDFKTRLSKKEQTAIKNTMLAISQIEVAVKSFWGDMYQKIPKPEIGSVGATFAESEVRHADAYSHLLEILGLNKEFEALKKKPVIMKRVKYLETALANSKSENNQEYSESVLLFSLFIEHVSLFSQFLIIMAFNKHRNMLKGISNVVEATSKEEQIHGDFGIDLIKILKSEHPNWFNDEYEDKIQDMCKKAYEAESAIVDWIFEDGELEFLPKKQINEFIKDRFNKSLDSVGVKKVFKTDEEILAKTEWFNDEIIGTKHGDFFVKRSINYSKRTQSITGEDLFETDDKLEKYLK